MKIYLILIIGLLLLLLVILGNLVTFYQKKLYLLRLTELLRPNIAQTLSVRGKYVTVIS